MIKVKFDYTDDGKSIVLTVKGHSDYSNEGKDTVCAAATMLTYTVAQIVKDLYDQKKLKKKPTLKLKKGESVITCKPQKDVYAEALHAFYVAEVGFNVLAHNFPNNVQLITFSSGSCH